MQDSILLGVPALASGVTSVMEIQLLKWGSEPELGSIAGT